MLLVFAITLAGCGSGGPVSGTDDDDDSSGCLDFDFDGYGEGTACAGEDCDDGDPTIADPADCAARCVEFHDLAPGCPCEVMDTRSCYFGAPKTQGLGNCRAGLMTCDAGRWGPCDGMVVPTEEFCDWTDNDCDGAVDEGVTTACGGCSAECDCVGDEAGCDDWDFDAGDGVIPCDGRACVTLGAVPEPVLWVASAALGTVSKIDTHARVESGRYRTSADAAAGPRTVAADLAGDAFVVNHGPPGEETVVRIANECTDLDGDGRIDTSAGSDLLAFGEDECLAWSTPIGCAGGLVPCGSARAVAVDDRPGLDGVIEERAWIGVEESTFLEIDRRDGNRTGVQTDCSPCTPWDAQVDASGTLWASCLSAQICRFDTLSPDDVDVLGAPGTTWGISVGADGRVWAGGDTAVYSPDVGSWESIDVAATTDVATDLRGFAWLAGTTSRVVAETLDALPVGAASYGIAVDPDGFVWAIPSGIGSLAVVDPSSLVIETVLDDCGGDCLPPLETWGDPAGDQLRIATHRALGTIRHVFEGCESGTNWMDIVWRAELPEGSSLAFSARSASTIEELAALELQPIAVAPTDASPYSLDWDLAYGNTYFEVQVDLSPGTGVPVLSLLGVEYACDIVF